MTKQINKTTDVLINLVGNNYIVICCGQTYRRPFSGCRRKAYWLGRIIHQNCIQFWLTRDASLKLVSWASVDFQVQNTGGRKEMLSLYSGGGAAGYCAHVTPPINLILINTYQFNWSCHKGSSAVGAWATCALFNQNCMIVQFCLSTAWVLIYFFLPSASPLFLRTLNWLRIGDSPAEEENERPTRWISIVSW